MRPRIKFWGWILLAAWALSACRGGVPAALPSPANTPAQILVTAAADVPPGMTAQAAATLRTLQVAPDGPMEPTKAPLLAMREAR